MKVFSGIADLPKGQVKGNITPGCIVLEGGAFRGLFTSGVLDRLMECGINMAVTAGVSAGALNAYNYVAGAIGRSARTNLTYRHDPRWVGLKALKTDKGIIGFDFCFNTIPDILPYDKEELMRPDKRLVVVATNVATGEAKYFEKDCGCLERAVSASASMPIASSMVYIDGQPYLDGGCADKVPLKWALSQGFKKIIVVRTKPRGFRRKIKRTGLVMRALYGKYPKFLASCERSAKIYNLMCEKMETLEAEKKIVAFYPTGKYAASRLEGDMEKLGCLYYEGYNMAKEREEEIRNYLGI